MDFRFVPFPLSIPVPVPTPIPITEEDLIEVESEVDPMFKLFSRIEVFLKGEEEDENKDNEFPFPLSFPSVYLSVRGMLVF